MSRKLTTGWEEERLLVLNNWEAGGLHFQLPLPLEVRPLSPPTQKAPLLALASRRFPSIPSSNGCSFSVDERSTRVHTHTHTHTHGPSTPLTAQQIQRHRNEALPSLPGRRTHHSEFGICFLCNIFPIAQMAKNLPVIQETRVRSLGREDPLDKGMATLSSILAWRIPWTEESGGLQFMGSQRVGDDTTTILPSLQQLKNVIMYTWLCWVSLAAPTFSSCRVWGLLFGCGAGSSLQGLLLFRNTSSRCVGSGVAALGPGSRAQPQ